ncbi:hypothetical protein EJB05_35957 [Eragrostis curvula]|uniref:Uncharacterized protein n=1 Tax=Eragrostis curvula TaxID=38414 RepID=A0A5J9U889_9POAL|nr:hypothetical protein EJB05_35957 [Eragrostis curvula]
MRAQQSRSAAPTTTPRRAAAAPPTKVSDSTHGPDGLLGGIPFFLGGTRQFMKTRFGKTRLH